MVRTPRFDPNWNRQRNWRKAWRAGRWWLGLAVVLGIAALLAQWNAMPGTGEPVEARFTICGDGRGASHCVIDGDTVAIGGFGSARRTVRLTGFDAPEMDGACAAEKRQAVKARSALQRWLNTAPFSWDGGAEPPYDQYGRELRSAWRGGEWLAETMIAAGLAADNGWESGEIDWCL